MEVEEGSICVLLRVPRDRLAKLRGSCRAVSGRVKRKVEVRAYCGQGLREFSRIQLADVYSCLEAAR